jgi:hypothetical protein
LRILSGTNIKPLRVALALGGFGVTTGFALWAVSRADDVLAFPIGVIFAVCLLHLVQQALCGCAWHALAAGPHQSRFVFFWMRWIRASVAALVPISGVGAAAVAVRLAVKRGIAPDTAVASLILDATVEMTAQILFTIIGVTLLLAIAPERQFLSWSVPNRNCRDGTCSCLHCGTAARRSQAGRGHPRTVREPMAEARANGGNSTA